ncbi:hypothetical protein [Sphaerisporangium rufum]|nr:hypothetical protein [Sphaerisporangium rufum]
MARVVAGHLLDRLLAAGGLILLGWLAGVVLAVVGADPAAAEVTVPAGRVPATEASHEIGAAWQAAADMEVTDTREVRRQGSAVPHVAPGPASAGGFPTAGDSAPADAGAMVGRRVDGLTSQSTPAAPEPASADHSAGANGFVPRGGGSGPSGPAFGDVARSGFDPRLMIAPARTASATIPVVRPAVDDPSFSPD